MHISWLGSTAIKIQTKPAGAKEDVIIVIDPYKPKQGGFPRSLTPNIGLYTNGKDGSITLSGEPFTLASPGEVETNGVLITAIQGHEKDHTMFRIDSEHMSIAHLGCTNKQPTNAQLELLGNIDMLCVPVGGDKSFDAEQAVKAVNAIEPRVVIPMQHKSDNDPKAASVKEFLKQMGASNGTEEKKVIMKKKDLPQEDTSIVVLSKE